MNFSTKPTRQRSSGKSRLHFLHCWVRKDLAYGCLALFIDPYRLGSSFFLQMLSWPPGVKSALTTACIYQMAACYWDIILIQRKELEIKKTHATEATKSINKGFSALYFLFCKPLILFRGWFGLWQGTRRCRGSMVNVHLVLVPLVSSISYLVKMP